MRTERQARHQLTERKKAALPPASYLPPPSVGWALDKCKDLAKKKNPQQRTLRSARFNYIKILSGTSASSRCAQRAFLGLFVEVYANKVTPSASSRQAAISFTGLIGQQDNALPLSPDNCHQLQVVSSEAVPSEQKLSSCLSGQANEQYIIFRAYFLSQTDNSKCLVSRLNERNGKWHSHPPADVRKIGLSVQIRRSSRGGCSSE